MISLKFYFVVEGRGFEWGGRLAELPVIKGKQIRPIWPVASTWQHVAGTRLPVSNFDPKMSFGDSFGPVEMRWLPFAIFMQTFGAFSICGAANLYLER